MAQKESSGAGRALAFLALAVTAGGVVTFFLYTLIEGYRAQIEEAQKPDDTVVVMVATRELFPGIPITEDDVAGIEFPEPLVHPHAYRSPEHVIHQMPRERILENEVILPDRLADGQAGVGLNALVEQGMRALSVNVADGRALSGFLNPGNRVDILVTITDEEGIRNTSTLLQAVPVLAVNDRTQNENRERAEGRGRQNRSRLRPSVTFAVTPEEAEEVAHASQQGEITLSLRSDLDMGHAASTGITSSGIFGDEPEPQPVQRAAPAPPDPGRSLTIIQGSQQRDVRVDEDGRVSQ